MIINNKQLQEQQQQQKPNPLCEVGYMDHLMHIKDTACYMLVVAGLTQPSSFTRV